MFKTCLKKIGEKGLYFFIPVKESLNLAEGKVITIQINNYPPFLKKLNIPQGYATRGGQFRWLFQITLPYTVIEKYNLKKDDEIEVLIKNGNETN